MVPEPHVRSGGFISLGFSDGSRKTQSGEFGLFRNTPEMTQLWSCFLAKNEQVGVMFSFNAKVRAKFPFSGTICDGRSQADAEDPLVGPQDSSWEVGTKFG
jgi:hypothetical protein